MPSSKLDALWTRLLELSPDSNLSLQAQIRQAMVAAIRTGQLPSNAPVPSSRLLAGQLKVARNTVVLAYQQLLDEGYLIARSRSGYFVAPGLALETLPIVETNSTVGPAVDWASRLCVFPDAQRNITKASDWIACKYPFIYGQFDSELFPVNEWRECCIQALRVLEVRGWAQDLITRDDPSPVEEIKSKILPLRGVWATTEEIIVTTGAQQALYLIADLLVNQKTHVGIEDPGYPDARNIFSLRAGALRPIPVDRSGLCIDDRLSDCNYIYTTPSHQSPTTVTMPMERRMALLEAAERQDFVVIEDDYETETSFAGLPSPALKSLDRSGRVIYVGSLSKALAPGLRLGFIVAPSPLLSQLRSLRRLMVRHPSSLIQRAFALFLSLGHYNALMRTTAVAHRNRADQLQSSLRQHLPELDFVPITGGASCWVSGPDWLDARRLAEAALQESVFIEPGDVYFSAAEPPRNHFRLGFSSISAARIDAGIAKLAPLVRAQGKT